MVRRETAGRQETSGGIFRERDGLFRSPEQSGGSERYQVSGVNDPAEVRAERTADAVMGGGVFREADSHASGDGIFRQAEGPGPEGGPAELSSADLSEPGDTLPGDLRQSMGESMGADFSDVRVHTGPGADRASRQISARAFTRGRDVYFRSGTYDPGSREGQRLIAHELAHVASGDSGLHRVVDVMTADPAALAPEKAPEVRDFVTERRTAFQNVMTANDMEGMRKKYVTEETVIEDDQIESDKNKITAIQQAMGEAAVLADKLRDGADVPNINNEIRNAYKDSEIDLRTELNAVKDDVEKMGEKVKAEKEAFDSAEMPDTVKEMVNDPVFDQFKKAVEQLSKASAGITAARGEFNAADEAAAKKARKNAAEGQKADQVSLKDKQAAMGIRAEAGGSRLSTIANGFRAAGKSAGVVSKNISGVTSAATDYVEGGKIEQIKLSEEEEKKLREEAEKKLSEEELSEEEMEERIEEEKKKAKEESAKLSSSRAKAAGGITEGVGEALSGVGDTLDTIDNSKKAEAQRSQDRQAKKSMRNIAGQLERAVPGADWGKPRSQRIKAVCDRVKQDKFNEGRDTMSDLISAAMDEKDASVIPPLSERQKKLLSALQLLESSRASSKGNAKNMRKEAVFSSLDAFGSILRSIGSLTSSIGGLSNSLIAGLVGAIFSLAGTIFGQIGAVRSAVEPKGGKGDETQKKMEASRGAIRQMAALPALGATVWDNLGKKARGESGAANTTRKDMFAAEQYAGVFFGIRAANVNIADILYAVEKGGFGTITASNREKTVEASLDDMYANLSFSS